MATLLERASKPDLNEKQRKALMEEVGDRMRKALNDGTDFGYLDKVLDKLLGTTLTKEDE